MIVPDYTGYFWRGDKTHLRQWQVDDAELRFITSLDSPTVAFHEGGIQLPTSVDRQQSWLEGITSDKDNNVLFFAMDNLQGDTVGWITMHSRDSKNGTFSFGICVYRDYRGNGYAVDAVRTLLKYGFWEQRYQKCNSVCLQSNPASVRLHEKLGFIKEGQIRRACFYDGEYHDEMLFGMTREEFDALIKS